MSNPLVTVYIPCHNYGRFLSQAVESVLQQSYKNWELFIIDDGSTDNTSEIVNLYSHHPSVSTFRTESIGLPSVINFALSRATGKYFIRLDGDDYFDPHILLVLVQALENDSNLALVFPDYFVTNSIGKILRHERREPFFTNNHMPDVPPHGACTLFRTSILKQLGGYREDLGSQDGFDIWSRVKHQFPVKNINLPLFYYRRHGTNLTENSQRIFMARRQIKNDAALLCDSVRPVIAVIPCRKYYDFVENLWSSDINDSTLLDYSIVSCLNSSFVDLVVVASDNEDVSSVVSSYNNPRLKFFLRSEQSTIRSSPIVPTLLNILDEYDPSHSGIIVLKYLHTPFVSTEYIDESITSLLTSSADTSLPVLRVSDTLYRRSSHGLSRLISSSPIASDFDEIYSDPELFVSFKSSNLLNGSKFGSRIACFDVAKPHCFAIRSMFDLLLASHLDYANV